MAATLPDSSVAKRVRWARKQSAYPTLDALAAKIGTTRQVIINWEKGKHLPNEYSQRRLAEATGIPAEAFSEEKSEDDEEAEMASDFFRGLQLMAERALERAVAQRVEA